MESNLFIELAEEQQEVVAGGAGFVTGSSFESLIKSLTTSRTFGGGSTSNASGTTTNGNFASTKNKTSNFVKNSGGTSIFD